MNVNYNEDTFVDRAKDRDVLAVKLFTQAGMSPNVSDKDGITPLMAAAGRGDTEIAEFLIGAEAAVNMKSPDKITALKVSIFGSHWDTLLALLEAGAYAEVECKYRNVLDFLRNHPKIVAMLRAAGAGIEDLASGQTGQQF